MKLIEQQFEFSKDVAKLIEYVFHMGYFVSIGECYRTQEQAEIYVKQGLGIKNSLHCDRLAVDLHIFKVSLSGYDIAPANEWTKFGHFWQSLNQQNRWGGEFKRIDLNHFERKKE